jgi:tRNA(Ile)-lysidine synthase TilS/MesJ
MTIAEVRERVRATGLLAPGTPVVAMLSGGRDSVCLLDVAVALCGAGSVHALHVNYGVRDEAAGDESACRELCEGLGVDLIVARSGRGPDAVGNFHAWAREFRYREARELAQRLEQAGVAGPSGGGPLPTPTEAPGEVEGGDVEGGEVEEREVEEGEVQGDEVQEGEVQGDEVEGGEVQEGEVEEGEAPSGGAAAELPGEADGGVEEVLGEVSKQAPPRVRVGHPIFESPTILIATGHTATDQVETILYRLAASPGRRALLGMLVSEGRLVRPLLALTREQTASYCRERGLSWREDASNDSEQYARARVRHGLVRALDAVHPAAQANVLRTAELLREETEVLDALVEAELAGRASIPIERLRELAPAMRRLVVIRLAEDATGTFVPQAGERVAEILALGARGGRCELHVGGLAGAVIERGELSMVAISPRQQHESKHGSTAPDV